jgi:hypothetical protein
MEKTCILALTRFGWSMEVASMIQKWMCLAGEDDFSILAANERNRRFGGIVIWLPDAYALFI